MGCCKTQYSHSEHISCGKIRPSILLFTCRKIITLTGFVHYMENKMIYRVLSQCIASRVLFLNLVSFVCIYIKCALAAVTAFRNEIKIFSSPDLSFIAAEAYLCNKHLFCLLCVKLCLQDHMFKNQYCIIYSFIWFILVL